VTREISRADNGSDNKLGINGVDEIPRCIAVNSQHHTAFVSLLLID